MKKEAQVKEVKNSKFRKFASDVQSACIGITHLAFISANGVAAYVLWFSSDSLTLKVVAGILALHAAVQAVKMSTNK